MMETNDQAELLEAICVVDSRTVEGAAGNVQVAEMLAERLVSMGFELEWVDTPPEEGKRGRHLKAVRNPAAPRRVVLMGHTDTVLSPGDVPFRSDPDSGRVYGAGVCDMKGGCVILLEAARTALEESQAVRDSSLLVLLDCSEELSGRSFPKLARATAKGAVACLSFEPARTVSSGEAEVVISRKGVVRFRLSCSGRAAHAGNDHQLGVNAIREAARKVEQIESLTDYDAGISANVGRIVGGRAGNQVAGEAFINFEVRAFEPDTLEHTCDAVKEICSRPTVSSAADGTTTRLQLSEHRSYPAWLRNSATDALARRYVELARKHDVAVAPVPRGGGSDASHVADLAPTLDGLGMLGDGMHTSSEWADLGMLPVRARIAADLIAELCAHQNARE